LPLFVHIQSYGENPLWTELWVLHMICLWQAGWLCHWESIWKRDYPCRKGKCSTQFSNPQTPKKLGITMKWIWKWFIKEAHKVAGQQKFI
jgi:hypothetical protein